jgi:hypothetical protein
LKPLANNLIAAIAMKIKHRKLVGLICLPFLFMFAGCPDYSHLRPVPDYENMTDSGGEPAEEDGSEQLDDQ